MKKIFVFLVFVLSIAMVSAAEAPKPANEPPQVTLENILTKLKMKGRAAVGYLNSQSGLQKGGSFEAPDIKLQLNFNPDESNIFTIRFNLNNAVAQNPLTDFVYLQAKDFIHPLKDTAFSISGRIGRFKPGFGEEVASNNSIEGALPSNSAANVDMNDEGVELSGKFWAFWIGNGNRGVGSDSHPMKAWQTKLFFTPWNPLYVSASYYDSGNLNTSNAEMTLAGFFAPPAGNTRWKRQVWEGDVRYDFGKGTKPLQPIITSDSKAIIRASYGMFRDAVNNGTGRMGYFGFTDGMYNLSSKIFIAGRASMIDLRGGQLAALNTVTTNFYQRFSLGGGFRWTENVHIKLGYDINKNGGTGTIDFPDNLISALVAVRL